MVEQLFGSEDVPDYYADAVRIAITPFSVAIEFGVSGVTDAPGEKGPVKRLATVRMSPQHALVILKILQKNMRAYEEKVGKIALPSELYTELGIEPN